MSGLNEKNTAETTRKTSAAHAATCDNSATGSIALGTAGAASAPDRSEVRRRLATSALFVLFALVAVAMTTFAWFTIADHAKARSLALVANAGNSLRFDLDEHASFDDYVKILGFEQIAARISQEQGVDIDTSKLQPVTTSDYQNFTFEDGSEASATSGAYLEFTLHFMSLEDVVVRLTGETGSDGAAGTQFSSNVDGLPLAMRMSFTCDGQTWVYDPNLPATASSSGAATVFGLSQSAATDASNMFNLMAEVDKSTIVRIWLEGTDPNCTNMLKGADYSISMRFEGVEEQQVQEG